MHTLLCEAAPVLLLESSAFYRTCETLSTIARVYRAGNGRSFAGACWARTTTGVIHRDGWSKKEEEKPGAESTSLSGGTGRCRKVLDIVLINSATVCTCSDLPSSLGHGEEASLYRWTILCLRVKTDKYCFTDREHHRDCLHY